MTFVNRGLVPCAVFGALLLALGCSRSADDATDAPPPPPPSAPGNGGMSGFPGAGESRPEGVLVNDARACRGYTLIAPLTSDETFLIDTDGRTVRTWYCGCHPALSASLLENGHLLRVGELPESERPYPHTGGRIQEFDWNGELVWDFRYPDERHFPHHDAIKLPNGNVLVLVCERIFAPEARAAGRHRLPTTATEDYLFADGIVEIKPTGRTTGEIVWEWRAWEHLIQEHDKTKPNFGSVADHPELVDLNFAAGPASALSAPGPEHAKLQSLGYVGAATGSQDPQSGSNDTAVDGDWTHLNAVAYNADLDQIAVTGLGFSEVWVIDHGTTRAEAAGHTGGKRGRGGDLLYRWGNPKAYRHGTSADARLTGPHSVQWIGNGLPGAGHLLVFNNGNMRPEHRISSVEEVVLPVDSSGAYSRPTKAAFGPEKELWCYTGASPEFFSLTFSGAQRLPNGNTLICLGMPGIVVEVTPEGEVVWKYVIPTTDRHAFSAKGPRSVKGPPAAPGMLPSMFLIGNSVFRAPRYAPDYPGLVGKGLTPASVP